MHKTFPMFPERWTPQILKRCTHREMLVIIAKYGLEQVARRLGDDQLVELIQKIIHNTQ